MHNNDVFMINHTWEGKTLEAYLKGFHKFSRRSIIALKKCAGVRVNGEILHMNILLKTGDQVQISMEDTESENIFPEQMQLNIIYEDAYFIVLNKPAGMPVHPTRRHLMGTLSNGLAYYWMGADTAMKIRPINRLDKDTSGLVIFAKSAHFQHLMSFHQGKEEFQKEYVAVVHGRMQEKSGTIELPIAREAEREMRRVVREDGDRADTHYRVGEIKDHCSIVRILLETGRTHQIRVHMSHIGHPLLGDVLYGGSTELIGRQALHAIKISMLHPVLQTQMTFEAPLPADMDELLQKL